MNLTDLRLVFNYAYFDEKEDDDKDINVCNVFIEHTNEAKAKNRHIVHSFGIEDGEPNKLTPYCICLEWNSQNLSIFREQIDFNVCLDFEFYDADRKIGGACLNRIFVDDSQTVFMCIDGDAPNSMDICNHILKKDFSNAEGRFIGIIDELLFDDDYIATLAPTSGLDMLICLLNHLGLNVYYLYTQPKHVRNVDYLNEVISAVMEYSYKAHRFKTVDKEKCIMRKVYKQRAKELDSLNYTDD